MATWTTSNSVLTMTLTVTESAVNTSANTSSMTWQLTITADSTWFTGRQIYWSVNIGGLTRSATSTVTASQGQTVTLGSGSGTIAHGSDGTKTITCTAHAERSGSWSSAWSAMNISQSLALTPIARHSQVGCSPSSVVVSGRTEDSFSIGFDIKNTSYYYVLTVSIPGVAEIERWTIHENASGYARIWTPPASMIDYFAPNSTTLGVQFNLVTYKSSTLTEANRLGTTAVQATLKTSEQYHSPSISNVTMVEQMDEMIDYGISDSTLVKMMSEKLITCSVTLKHTAIQIATVGCGNAIAALEESSGGTYTATLHEPDGDHIYIDVLDERGYSARYEVPCTVVDYHYPSLITAEVKRTTPTGGGVSVKIRGKIYGGYVGTEQNTLYLYYRWKENVEGATETSVWQLQGEPIDMEGYREFVLNQTLLTSFDYRKSYLVKFVLTDGYGFEASSSDWLPIYEGIPVFSWGKDHFDVYGELHIHDREDPENIYSVVKPTEMAVKVYQGNYTTGSISGGSDSIITIPLPTGAEEVLAIIPFGATPVSPGNWSTLIEFGAVSLSNHTVSVRTIGSNAQAYVIRYVIIYR